MEECNPAIPSEGSERTAIPPIDAAAYLFEITREMAAMADGHGFSKLAAALELSRSLAAEALATLAVERQPGKAAPEDAA